VDPGFQYKTAPVCSIGTGGLEHRWFSLQGGHCPQKCGITKLIRCLNPAYAASPTIDVDTDAPTMQELDLIMTP